MQIEPPVPFAASKLWALQRSYFETRSIDAWRMGDVPHYIASNPTVADAFADLVVGLALDLRRQGRPSAQPIHICELGAGTGRFAFHFLTRLSELCARADIPLSNFRYILTDVVPENRVFWRAHPRFQDYFASGVLDSAAFDVMAPAPLVLDGSGVLIETSTCDAPLVVIANYLFDSVPSDLLFLDEGHGHRCNLALDLDDADVAEIDCADPAELLAALKLTYGRETAEAAYAEPWLDAILDSHRREITRSHVLFPAAALRCLDVLRGYSRQGLMLVSLDMGQHHPAALDGQAPPAVNRHGSISLPVNYYAIRLWCEQKGGLALVPNYAHRSITAGCYILAESESYRETRAAFARSIEDIGPDAFFTISRHARRFIDEMSLEEILAYLRLSHFDAHLFAAWLPRLHALADDCDEAERLAVIDAVDRVWRAYFPIGETFDLAEDMGALLYALEAYAPALVMFTISGAIYGEHTGKLFNRAACLAALGQQTEAVALLERVLAHDADNMAAAELRASLLAEAD